jgi:hypothetical protein
MTLDRLLLILGVGFLVANLRALSDLLWQFRRRRHALLVWPSHRPPYFPMLLAMGGAMGALLLSNLVSGNLQPGQLFGETMMCLYYAGAVPLGRQVRRGFYEQGVWTDSRFLPYEQIGGLSWRSVPDIALILLVRGRGTAMRLRVPGSLYGAARRVLRDQIAAAKIQFGGTGLELGAHDRREDV